MKSLKVTIVTTMLSDGRGVGEWGFAALVEADERRILFDTGARPDTIIINSRELGINLNGIPDVILSHNHGDHTTGLVTLRDQLRDARIHTGKGVFYSRQYPKGEGNFLVANRSRLKVCVSSRRQARRTRAGCVADRTGPAPVRSENFGAGPEVRLVMPEGETSDTIPEDTSMVFDTAKGLVVLSGCGHAGIANTLVRADRRPESAHICRARRLAPVPTGRRAAGMDSGKTARIRRSALPWRPLHRHRSGLPDPATEPHAARALRRRRRGGQL